MPAPAVTPLPPRLPDEPLIWYRRFCHWLEQDGKRNMLDLYNQERAKKGQKKAANHPGAWRDKPALYEWEKRAAAWDDAEALRVALENAKERKRLLEDELKYGKALVEKGLEGLKVPFLNGEIVTKEDVNGKQVERIVKLRGNPKAIAVGADLVEHGLALQRRALKMIDPGPLDQYKLHLLQWTDSERQRLIAGEPPLEVLISALQAEREKRPGAAAE